MAVSDKPALPTPTTDKRTLPANDCQCDAMQNSRADDSPQQKADRYGQLIERCTDAIFLLRHSRIVSANRAALRLTGIPREDQLLGCQLPDILRTAETTAGDRGHAAMLSSGECPTSFECTLLMTDGTTIDAEITMTPYADMEAADRRLVVVRDLAARKHLAAALSQQDQYLRLITDAVPALIAYIDNEQRYRFVNTAYETWFGPRSHIIGNTVQSITGLLYPQLRPYMERALRGERVSFEFNARYAPGDRKAVAVYTPDLASDGTVRGFSSMVMDITPLREAEERLQRREQEFKMLVENSPDIISRIDRDMRHIYVNPAIEKLTGLKAAAYLGKTKEELGLPATVVHAWDVAAKAAFEQGTEQRLDFDCVVDGDMRFYSGRVVPEFGPDGGVDTVVGIAYDVTARARMEKERDELLTRERTARIQAETAARARDEFLAIVSHELRAPLNGIQSWAHVLENHVKDVAAAPLAQRALQGIKTGVSQQVRLIEDLLDVTRMMSGKLRLVRQPLALLPTLQSAVESVRHLASPKHIGITCNYRITSEQIEGDTDRIQQVFWNLLTNAIKFTPEGGNVWLEAGTIDKDICVTVRDSGVGISPEFLPQLFSRFSQEDTTTTRGHSGLGLGLFLVRHLVELHGGRVTAHSEGHNKGTSFSVFFPMRLRSDKYLTVDQGSDGVGEVLSLPSLDGLRILLIDDQEEARESLTMVLTAAGADVFAAGSAAEVLNWLPTLAEDEFPDVLVCDIAMPGEDGYAVLRKLRAWKSTAGTTPLKRMPALALTAFAQREDRIRALTAGFQMHVTKPVAPEELIIVLDTMASHR